MSEQKIMRGYRTVEDNAELKHNAEAARILRMASRLFKLINIDPQFMGTVEACDISEAEWKQMKAWAENWLKADAARGDSDG